MNRTENFTQDQIPYQTLNRFGLTQEMVEDLPESVMNRLLAGRRTPVLPIRVVNEANEEISTSARISLCRTDAGDCRVMFYPRFTSADLSRFDKGQQDSLNEGRAVRAEVKNADGKKVLGYYQVDPTTNHVISAPVAIIENNLKYIADELGLSKPEHNCLKNGNPLTVNDGDEQITVGVNLNSKSGVKVVNGNEQTWKQASARDYDKFNFGLNGCWVSDENGTLSYIREEEYSEDMWDEMRNRGNMRNMAMGLSRAFKM